MPARPARSRAAAATATVALAAVAGCTGGPAGPPEQRPRPAAEAAPSGTPSPRPTALPPLRGRVRPDVLVVNAAGLAPAQVDALRRLAAGGFATLRVGEVRVGAGRQGAVGVDPAAFRPFAPAGTAEATPVWQSVARGEAVVAHDVAKALKIALGRTVEVAAAQRLPLRVGALATVGLPDLGVVVSDEVAGRLGLPPRTGAVLSAGAGRDPVALAREVQRVVGSAARVELLSQPTANPMAFLTGSRAARAFGAFSYRYHPDGTIEPDARWVRQNIRYATLPIVGTVRCHRLMVPQLRAALAEIQRAGLGRKLYSFAGCYVPRFIERDPDRAISLHTWGIAVDFNVATNQVGTHGDMDPRIVAIFERWGFRWGGRWRVPDPMHFELAALLDT